MTSEAKGKSSLRAQSAKALPFFQTNEAYSSIGKMVLSSKQSMPVFGFGTSDRDKEQKRYVSDEMSKSIHVAKYSPGPNYDILDHKFQYKEQPRPRIGTAVRNTLETGAKYDHYHRGDVDFAPDNADNGRRTRPASVRFGTQSRFDNGGSGWGRRGGTPGPQYNPGIKPEVPKSAKYSFGFRRDIAGSSPLVLLTSTGPVVGPGKYAHNQESLSKFHDPAKITMPKDIRDRQFKPVDRNQTFDAKTKAIGVQVNSKKKTMPIISFGKAKRDVHTGTFKDMMATQPTQVRIAVPKY